MSNKIFIIGGGGGFGFGLAQQLLDLGADVMIADKDPDRVDTLQRAGWKTVQLDAANEQQIANSDALTSDAVVISTGASVQAGIYAALVLKHLKVRRVIACASDAKCARLLEGIGAEVIQPAHDVAHELAKRMMLKTG
jgi:trk system potassium uptake protein TrkA